MARYLVFARTEYAEPLTHRGEVEAADGDEGAELALERHGRDWVELVLVPEAAIRWILRADEARV
jgi:hypothetical protein